MQRGDIYDQLLFNAGDLVGRRLTPMFEVRSQGRCRLLLLCPHLGFQLAEMVLVRPENGELLQLGFQAAGRILVEPLDDQSSGSR